MLKLYGKGAQEFIDIFRFDPFDPGKNAFLTPAKIRSLSRRSLLAAPALILPHRRSNAARLLQAPPSVAPSPCPSLVNNVQRIGTGTSAAIDTTGADFIVISLSFFGGGSTPVISDNKLNGFPTPLTIRYNVTATTANQLFYYTNPTVGSGHTFIIGSTPGSNAVIDVIAFKNVATTSPFDVENGATGAGNTLATGSITPVAKALIIAGTSSFWSSPASATIDSGLAITDQTGGVGGTNYAGAIAWIYQAASAAINPTWTFGTGTGSFSGGSATIASFKPGAGC